VIDSKARVGFVGGAILALVTAGCGAGDREPLPDWSDGFDGPGSGVGPDPTGAPVELRAAQEIGIDMRLSRSGTNEPCAVGINGTLDGYQEIECTLDIAEGDLYFSGLHFELTVPSGVCDYMVWNHYMYLAWPMGTPDPPDVTYDKDATTGAISNEVNSIEGEPICEFDHSAVDGPNCCLGKYKVIVNEGGAITESAPLDWGGKPADCYYGAAYLDPEMETTMAGWPAARYVQLDKQAFYKSFDFPPLASFTGLSVPYASFYNPGDNTGAPPLALGDIAKLNAPTQIEYYEFTCTDTALERYARINMRVREWNTQGEYQNYGNPDVVGQEPSGGPFDDVLDWGALTLSGVDYVRDQ
jgi:hypothetical protein